MNNLYKKLGIKESQVIKTQVTTREKSSGTDSEKVKQVRKAMNNTYLKDTKIITASYLAPIYKRDESNKILLDKNKKKVAETWTPKTLQGQFILEDNKDGTHTATKLNVYKETYIIDSETLEETKVN